MTRQCYAKVHKYKRGDIWWVRFWHKGKRYDKSLKTKDENVAELSRHSIENRLRTGRLFLQHRRASAAVKEVAEEYLTTLVGDRADSTIYTYRNTLSMFIDFARPDKIYSITTRDIEAFRKKRLATRTAKTVKNDLGALSAFFNYCVRQGYICENPMNGVTKVKRTQEKLPRFLSEEEVETVLENATDDMEIASALGIYAGLRRAEMLQLRWEDIDFKARLIFIRKAKSRRIRSIPLHKKLRNILKKYEKRSGLVLQPCDGRYFSRKYGAFLRKLGIEDAGLHTLRHTFASRLVQKGISVYKVSKWLGHSNVIVTSIYAHLTPQDGDIDVL